MVNGNNPKESRKQPKFESPDPYLVGTGSNKQTMTGTKKDSYGSPGNL